MATNTCAVSGQIVLPDDTDVTGGRLVFRLSSYDVDSGETVSEATVVAAVGGDGSVSADLWPNHRGVRASYYTVALVRETSAGDVAFDLGRIQVPDASSADISDLLGTPLVSETVNWTTITTAQYNAFLAAVDAIPTAPYVSRAALVSAWSDGLFPDGAVTSDGSVQYLANSGATDISDLTGLSPYGRVDIRHFGAVGDGTTDDSTAIQAAIDYAALQGGGRVSISTGTYALVSTIILKNGVHVEGEGYPSEVYYNSTRTGPIIKLAASCRGGFRFPDEARGARLSGIMIDVSAVTSAGSVSITDITSADPPVLTGAGHPFEDEDLIYLDGVVGMTELNDGIYQVRNTTTDTFSFSELDSTGLTAYSSGGTATHRPYAVMMNEAFYSSLADVTVFGLDNDDVIGFAIVGGEQTAQWLELDRCNVFGETSGQGGTGFYIQGYRERGDGQPVNQTVFRGCRAVYIRDGWIIDGPGAGIVLLNSRGEACIGDGFKARDVANNACPLIIGGEFAQNTGFGVDGRVTAEHVSCSSNGTNYGTEVAVRKYNAAGDVDFSQPHTFDDGVNIGAHNFNSTGLSFDGGTRIADFDVGTFEATIFGTSTAGSNSYTEQTVNYVRINNVWFLAGRIAIDGTLDSTGNLRIGNLPATPGGPSGASAGGVCVEQRNGSSISGPITLRTVSGSGIQLQQISSGATANITDANAGTNFQFRFTAMYFTG